MAKKPILAVEERQVFGKKVQRLRDEGILPANIFGKNIKSSAVQVDQVVFQKLLREVGETEIIDLKVKGERKPRPVLISNVQLDPVSNKPLHCDFRQVDLSEKISVAIPLEFIGTPSAVKEGKGVLLELKSELEVEALPTDLPSEIKVDVSGLGEINDVIAVKDLELPKEVTAQADPHELVCKIESPQVGEEEKATEVPAEEVASEAEERAEDADQKEQPV